MDSRTANHFSIAALLTTTLALLAVNAAPASINHAEVSRKHVPYTEMSECLAREHAQRSTAGI